MKNTDLNKGTQLRVIKDIYYLTQDHFSDGEYLEMSEIEERLAKFLCKGDIWEVVDENTVECIEGDWKGECNEGWFMLSEMLNKGVFELV